MRPGHYAKILPALIGLGLAATACSSTSSSSSAHSNTAPTAPQPTASFLGSLHGLTKVASTVPANGDVNPYGVAVVPASAGRLTAGDILVSNFNDKANVQGTGTTLVQVSPAGQTSVFANISAPPASQACPGGIGLTTAPGRMPSAVVRPMPPGQVWPAGNAEMLANTLLLPAGETCTRVVPVPCAERAVVPAALLGDLDDVRADLLSVVNRSLEPAHLPVWLAPGGATGRGTPHGSRASTASS